MKVTPAGFWEREALEEEIHEPGFAAANAAPEIQPALRLPRRAADEAAEPAT